jgi:hypothetical protein
VDLELHVTSRKYHLAAEQPLTDTVFTKTHRTMTADCRVSAFRANDPLAQSEFVAYRILLPQ